ncbi:hypothetical protein BC828DRAFT_406612 [Blastocladiella britannica]|nr:hypothetical protein BC828DRAFT_406612 [Blastocladiella britannica]
MDWPDIILPRTALYLDQQSRGAVVRINKAWRSAVLQATPPVPTTVTNRTALVRLVASIRAGRLRGSALPRSLVLRNIKEPRFTGGRFFVTTDRDEDGNDDDLDDTWLAALLVPLLDRLESLVVDSVHPFHRDAVAVLLEQIAQVTSPQNGKGGGKKESFRHHGSAPFSALTVLQIRRPRDIDAWALHAFLYEAGAAMVPAKRMPSAGSSSSSLPERNGGASGERRCTIRRLALVDCDYALTAPLVAACLPRPTELGAPASISHHYSDSDEQLPTYAEAEAAALGDGALRHLSLDDNAGTVTDMLLMNVFNGNGSSSWPLVSVSLVNATGLTPVGLSALARATAPMLQRLSIAGCTALTRDLCATVAALSPAAPHLRDLDLADISALVDGGPIRPQPMSIKVFPRLERLRIAYSDAADSPCACAGLQVPLATLAAMSQLEELAIYVVPGAGALGGVPAALLRQLVVRCHGKSSLGRIRITHSEARVRADRIVEGFRYAATVRQWHGCVQEQCLGAVEQESGQQLVQDGELIEGRVRVEVEQGPWM